MTCQSFSNLFINLCKGTPSHFKGGIKDQSTKGVLKRIQMIIYLSEMNKLLIGKKELKGENEFNDLGKELNDYYKKLLINLNFYDYTFGDEKVFFRLPFMKLCAKLIKGHRETLPDTIMEELNEIHKGEEPGEEANEDESNI